MKGRRSILAALVAMAACSGDSPTENRVPETPPGNARFLGQWKWSHIAGCENVLYTFSMQDGELVGELTAPMCEHGAFPEVAPVRTYELVVTAEYPTLRMGFSSDGRYRYQLLPNGPGDADDTIVTLSEAYQSYLVRHVP